MPQGFNADFTADDRSSAQDHSYDSPLAREVQQQVADRQNNFRTRSQTGFIEDDTTNSGTAYLPDNYYLSHEMHSDSWLGAVKNVSKELFAGASSEICDHPLRVAADAAIGFGVGLGMTLLSPVVATTAGVAMAGVGLYEVATHAKNWVHDISIVAEPDGHKDDEVVDAIDGVRSLGAGALDTAAGLAGGWAGAKFGSSEVFSNFKNEIKEATSTVYFDQSGRPTKLQLPGNTGAAYLEYDKDGKVVSLEEVQSDPPASPYDIGNTYRRLYERQTAANGATRWTSTEGVDGIGTTEWHAGHQWHGNITVSPDNSSVTVDAPIGTLQLNSVGDSTWTQSDPQFATYKKFVLGNPTTDEAIRAGFSERRLPIDLRPHQG